MWQSDMTKISISLQSAWSHVFHFSMENHFLPFFSHHNCIISVKLLIDNIHFTTGIPYSPNFFLFQSAKKFFSVCLFTFWTQSRVLVNIHGLSDRGLLEIQLKRSLLYPLVESQPFERRMKPVKSMSYLITCTSSRKCKYICVSKQCICIREI